VYHVVLTHNDLCIIPQAEDVISQENAQNLNRNLNNQTF